MKKLATFNENHQVYSDEEISKQIRESMKELTKQKGPEDKKYLVLMYLPSDKSYGEDDKVFEIFKGRTKTYETLKDLIIECNLDVHESIVIVETVTLEQALSKNRERDIRIKSTSVGPHRDDICFMAGELDIRRFGSQGQQRTAALSLKLSEIELVKQAAKDTPVLLLDDVLSELDKHRQNYLLDSINDIQTLITCTGVEDFVNHRFSINKVFHVHNGQVTNEN